LIWCICGVDGRCLRPMLKLGVFWYIEHFFSFFLGKFEHLLCLWLVLINIFAPQNKWWMTTRNIFLYLFTLDAVNWDGRGYILGEGYIFVSIKEDIYRTIWNQGKGLNSQERVMVWFATCHYLFLDAVFLFLLVDTWCNICWKSLPNHSYNILLDMANRNFKYFFQGIGI
jgi:hypothetical protein